MLIQIPQKRSIFIEPCYYILNTHYTHTHTQTNTRMHVHVQFNICILFILGRTKSVQTDSLEQPEIHYDSAEESVHIEQTARKTFFSCTK